MAIHLAVDGGLPQSLRLFRNDKQGVFISREAKPTAAIHLKFELDCFVAALLQ